MRVEVVALPEGLVRVTVPFRTLSEDGAWSGSECAREVRLYRARGEAVVRVVPGAELPARVGLHEEGPPLLLNGHHLVNTLRRTLNLPLSLPGLTERERSMLGLPSKP